MDSFSLYVYFKTMIVIKSNDNWKDIYLTHIQKIKHSKM